MYANRVTNEVVEPSHLFIQGHSKLLVSDTRFRGTHVCISAWHYMEMNPLQYIFLI